MDTHLLVWAASGSDRRSAEAAALMEDRANELWFSAATIWELGIKRSRRPEAMPVEAERFRNGLRAQGYRELAIDSDHALASNALPWLHRDPFDRIMLAQAVVEGMTLLTSDAKLGRYPGPVRLV